MSCPIPIRIINPRYKKLSKDTHKSLEFFEKFDDFYLDVPCGKCFHCVKKYKSQWNFRLQQHYRYLSDAEKRNSWFVTLTFDDSYLPPNESKPIARLIRLFLERVRKKFNRSVTHWFCTELGSTTKRLHLHGILFDPPFRIFQLSSFWKYGFVSYAPLTPKRITYITSYVTKEMKSMLLDVTEKQFVFCSPGIGKSFAFDSVNLQVAHYDNKINPLTYFNNRPFALPRYLRLKMFSPESLENLKLKYFANQCDDVIPDPPYILGHKVFTDYTIFKRESDILRKQYINKYLKPIWNYGKSIQQSH